MDLDDLIHFFKKCELTEKLNSEEIKELLPYVESKTFQADEIVFNEGDSGRELYIIKSGNLDIVKKIDDQEKPQVLETLGEGSFFGEMAHLENEKRSAAVRSQNQSQLLLIKLDDLQNAEDKQILYSKIIAQLGKKVSQHLRKTDQSLIESLKEKLAYMQAHNQISKSLVHIIVLVTLWFNVSMIVKQFQANNTEVDLIFTSVLLLMFALSMMYVIRSSGYPLEFYGITLKRWFFVSVEAIIFSLPIIILLWLLKWVLVTYVGKFQGLSVFVQRDEWRAVMPLALIYVVLSPVQELIARGGIQSSFRNFFQGEHRAFQAILVSNLIFQVLHTVKSFWIAAPTLVIGFFWGYLFERQRSIVGVSVSHAIIGAWSFFILDYDKLFQIIANT